MKSRFHNALGALLLTAAALLVPAAAIGKDAPASVPRAAPVPLLWKVSGADGSELYLLGSFHLLKPQDYPPSADVEQAFVAARRLLFELSPQELASPTLPAQMLQAAVRQDGRQLKDDLDAATWTRLQGYARANALPLDRLAGMKPWFVGLSISLAQMAKQGLDPQSGLDRYLMGRADAAGKPASGLETGAGQIALLDGMDTLEQRQLLREALEQAEQGDADGQRLYDAWRRGDEAMLWKDMAQQMKRGYPQLYRRINVDRNDAWVPLLEQQLKPGRGSTLVVVGALHLLGNDGVVEKLRARGYAVKRICSSCQPQKKAAALRQPVTRTAQKAGA
ncbi:TraB/GumN family protein [Stenotrophomonas sp. YIM B06876]|uniref:TraB/GumN family protein n=1 Tax=Stenotrophomonas sp. YIM B06876 TaxID=3060211 RepID=UPI0027389397|nr:TraB/GumN family protein [Stenotrophomonas sp. YIM B06876]